MSSLVKDIIAPLESGSPDISALICEARGDNDMPTDAWDEKIARDHGDIEVPLFWQLPAVLQYATLISFWKDCEL